MYLTFSKYTRLSQTQQSTALHVQPPLQEGPSTEGEITLNLQNLAQDLLQEACQDSSQHIPLYFSF